MAIFTLFSIAFLLRSSVRESAINENSNYDKLILLFLAGIPTHPDFQSNLTNFSTSDFSE